MKTDKRDWLNFTAGFATATIMALAVSDAFGTTESMSIKNNTDGLQTYLETSEVDGIKYELKAL